MIAVCACLQQVQAQYDARLSQYYMAKSYYNPAVAGASDDLNIFGLARLEWGTSILLHHCRYAARFG